MPRLLSVNVGLPKDIVWQGKAVHTAVWKAPVDGPRMVRRLNVDGDGQGDLAGHGGEHRAVFVYQRASYRHWQAELGRDDFTNGQFGENFTVDGLPDTEVCIGDRYRIGGALFEVTQPRVTCYRVGIRMDEPRMAALLVSHGRPGFYFRVLEEGEVQAGDDIALLAPGPEKMTVCDVNALLYQPGHSRNQLERALRIPALSIGWRKSFDALLAQQRTGSVSGNAGLYGGSNPPLAWPGFRLFRVSRKDRESSDVVSLRLQPEDGDALPLALPGQFIVLKLGSALMRSYSLSAEPDASFFRVSVKREPHGAASAYIADALKVGDVVHVSAARGGFTLRPGTTPVVLLSAGIGVTPVLAMLHALAAEPSTREVWWLYGTQNGREHPFAAETRALLQALPNSHRCIRYSAPGADDRPQVDFDAAGRFSKDMLKHLGLPGSADCYVCGPVSFMTDMTAGLSDIGVKPDRIHTETFGAGPSLTPGVVPAPPRPPHLPAGPAGTGPHVAFARSGVIVRWSPAFSSVLDLAEACDVPVRWSCRTGVCHNCESGLVEGQIHYDPEPLDPPANGNLLICCARPQGDIVIDL